MENGALIRSICHGTDHAAYPVEAVSGSSLVVLEKESDAAKRTSLRHQANQEIADMVKKEASDTLNKVLYELSNQMKNAYSRSDA